MYINLIVCKRMTDVKLLLLHSNTWIQITIYKKKMNSSSLKNVINKMF